MIRTPWAILVTVLATLGFGLIAIGASLFRVRGGVYSWATRQWSRTILWASGVRVQVHGAEHARWDAPQVLVANHVSAYDIVALAAVIPSNFYFVAKKELESVPFFGMAWKAAGHISIDRSNRQRALASLRTAAERIRLNQGTVIIFPEGTRSRTGELLPFKKGAFQLAMEAGVPVLPAVLVGSYEIMKPGTLRIRPRPIHLHFSPALDPAAFSGDLEQLVQQAHGDMTALLERSRGEVSAAA